jgi:hypothetical protein
LITSSTSLLACHDVLSQTGAVAGLVLADSSTTDACSVEGIGFGPIFWSKELTG